MATPVSTSSGAGTFTRVLVGITLSVGSLLLLGLTFDFLRDSEADRLVVAGVAIAVGVFGVFGLFWGDEPSDRPAAPATAGGSPARTSSWVPRSVILSVFLIYPVINTILLSFHDSAGQEFVGLDNYRFIFEDEGMLRSMRNTLLWIVLVPAVAVSIGLGVRRARRPAAPRRGHRQVVDLPPDGDLVRRGRGHVAPHLQLPARRPSARTSAC